MAEEKTSVTIAQLDTDKLRDEVIRPLLTEFLPKKETAIVPVDEAEMEQLKGLTDIKVLGLPLGSAVMGGVSALIINEVVDLVTGPIRDRMGTYGPPLVKVGSAWVLTKFGKRFVGSTAANLGAAFLIWAAVDDVFNLSTWLRGLIPGQHPREFGATPLLGAGRRAPRLTAARTPMVSGSPVTLDYYAGLGGGR